MSYEHTPDGGIAEVNDATHSQPRFLGIMGLVLIALLIIFPLFIWYANLTH